MFGDTLGHGVTTLYGLKLIVSEDQPRMQLSARVKEVLRPEFAAEIDAWMRGFFGVTNWLADGQCVMAEQAGFVTMNPRTFANLRAALREGNHAG